MHVSVTVAELSAILAKQPATEFSSTGPVDLVRLAL